MPLQPGTLCCVISGAQEPIWVFVLTLPELKPMIYHTIMHYTLKQEAVENVPGIT